uniref:Uncharacterized protein n=1 Tax=Rhizophora mucronata TaxID=61149 RepID=A0A2P2Q843_RHIMU
MMRNLYCMIARKCTFKHQHHYVHNKAFWMLTLLII